MCNEEWCLRIVLEATMSFLHSVADGELMPYTLCTRLATDLEATTTAFICFDTNTQICTMTCWPQTVDLLALKVVVERLPHAFPTLLDHLMQDRRPSCLSCKVEQDRWKGSLADIMQPELLDCEDVAQLPLHGAHDTLLRLIVLAAPKRFSVRHMHLLDSLQRPLMTIDKLVRDRLANADAGVPCNSTAHRAGLTPREVEVLTMVSDGLLARTIAARLDVSPRTVHKHLGNAYRKLGAHDRLIAVRRAQSLGLISSALFPVPASDRGDRSHG
jgi:DNA-binding CsgD family transcriptional regulator